MEGLSEGASSYFGSRIAESNVEELLASSLCLGFAFLAGFFQGFFGCLLAWCARQKSSDAPAPAWVARLNIAGVIGSATLPGVLSIAALAFGAISMVVVVRSSSILVFNVLFTRAFRLGSIKKNDAVGTALCLLGIVALFKAAPTDSSITDSDFVRLLLSANSLGWNSLLVLACAVCIALVFVLEKQRAAHLRAERQAAGRRRRARTHSEGALPFQRAALVSVVVASSSACMDLSAKGYTGSLANTKDSLFLSSGIFWASLVAFAVSAVVMRGCAAAPRAARRGRARSAARARPEPTRAPSLPPRTQLLRVRLQGVRRARLHPAQHDAHHLRLRR